MASDEVNHPLYEIHWRLGRCVLRLQWYEQLLKALVVDHAGGGPIGKLEVAREQRLAKYANHSLGMTVGAFTESVLALPEAQDPESGRDTSPPTEPSFNFRFSLGMTEEARQHVTEKLAKFVALRNDLIHKLVEKFDLPSAEGRSEAIQHLVSVERRIDAEWEQLKQWRRSMRDDQALLAAFVESPTFENLVVNGIRPDGSIDWRRAGITEALREAADFLRSLDGWVRLDDAIGWIAERHPDQTPERYGCRTWPQVLHEARCFELSKRTDASGSKTKSYRVRLQKGSSNVESETGGSGVGTPRESSKGPIK